MGVYKGKFTNDADVAGYFNAPLGALNGAEVLLAVYEDDDSYGGHAFVLYRKDGTLYEVHASHCSCYGLEGQWQPEATTLVALSMRLQRGKDWYFCHLRPVLDALIAAADDKYFGYEVRLALARHDRAEAEASLEGAQTQRDQWMRVADVWCRRAKELGYAGPAELTPEEAERFYGEATT